MSELLDQSDHYDVICQFFKQTNTDESDQGFTFKSEDKKDVEENNKLQKKKHKKDDDDTTASMSVITERDDLRLSTLIINPPQNVICSIKNPVYLPMPNENRLDYLFRIPSLLQNAKNSSSFEMMKHLIDETFTENCFIKLGYMDFFRGRESFYQHCVATRTKFPDLRSIDSEPKMCDRCIAFKVHTYGSGGKQTGLASDKQSHLFNPFEAVPIDKMDESMLAMKKTYDRCIEQNILIRIIQKVVVYYILNKSKTHFEARITKQCSLQLFEDTPVEVHGERKEC